MPFQKTICWSREVSATDGAEAIGAPPVTRPAPVQPVPLFHASQRLLSVPFHQIAWWLPEVTMGDGPSDVPTTTAMLWNACSRLSNSDMAYVCSSASHGSARVTVRAPKSKPTRTWVCSCGEYQMPAPSHAVHAPKLGASNRCGNHTTTGSPEATAEYSCDGCQPSAPVAVAPAAWAAATIGG